MTLNKFSQSPAAPFFTSYELHTNLIMLYTMQVNDKKHNTLGVILALAVIAGCIVGIIRGAKNHKEALAPEVPKYSAVQLLREQHRDELTPWELTIMAIFWTESKCNPNAVGKAGDYGIMQMLDCYCREVNRISGSNYAHTDAFSIRKSLEMYHTMQGRYNPSKDLDLAIYYHNKSAAYKAEVERNKAWIKRYEAARNEVVDFRAANYQTNSINYQTNYKANYKAN